MPFQTPLRYPGGKRRLSAFVMRLLEANNLHGVQYVEPYAGGASLALALLLGDYASVIHINDLSRPVYAFWHEVLNGTDALCERIEATDVTMAEWHRQRAVYDNRDHADLGDLAFATFFLNRTNRSGIIAGGVIGGKGQTGRWSLDARFTKGELIRRIRRIAAYRDRIHLYNQDALDFTNTVVVGLQGDVFAFYDPPYIEKGLGLYLNDYTLAGHQALARRITKLKQPWVVTYDYEAAVRNDLYPNARRLAFQLSYSAQARHHGSEVMFLSDRLVLPAVDASGRIPMSPQGSAFPVHATLEPMSNHPTPEMAEGPDAAKRFVKALKAIVSVPKGRIPDPRAPQHPKRKPAR